MTERISDEKLAEWEALAKAAYRDYGLADVAVGGGERATVTVPAFISFTSPSFALSAIAEIHRLRGERDEAVRHLRAMSHVAPRDYEVQEALDYLAKLEQKG